MIPTIQTLLADARKRLEENCDSPQLDAELLLAHVIGKDRSYFYTWPDHTPQRRLALHFEDLLQRRLRGEPVAHILGEREFWSLRLMVTADTLIPRPETELLVELALALAEEHQPPASILDLGTGSGALALALALELPDTQITATDLSEAALEIARKNAQRHGLMNIRFAQGDWYAALQQDERYDLIVSNPPYIPEKDPHLETAELRHEPLQALASGPKGLDAINRILDDLHQHLRSGGWLLIEHGYDQGPQVQELFRRIGLLDVRCQQDLEGRDRITLGRKGLD
jgi:release factor glutamine methyltransferase